MRLYRPLRSILKITNLERLSSWPGLSIFFTPPVSVEDVGRAAFRSAVGELSPVRNRLTTENSSKLTCNIFDGEGIETIAK
jgi:hypothetical protein